MILYFAGNGRHIEQMEGMYAYEKWGVLLSYKDLKKANEKSADGNKRFRLLCEQKKQGGRKDAR